MERTKGDRGSKGDVEAHGDDFEDEDGGEANGDDLMNKYIQERRNKQIMRRSKKRACARLRRCSTAKARREYRRERNASAVPGSVRKENRRGRLDKQRAIARVEKRSGARLMLAAERSERNRRFEEEQRDEASSAEKQRKKQKDSYRRHGRGT